MCVLSCVVLCCMCVLCVVCCVVCMLFVLYVYVMCVVSMPLSYLDPEFPLGINKVKPYLSSKVRPLEVYSVLQNVNAFSSI